MMGTCRLCGGSIERPRRYHEACFAAKEKARLAERERRRTEQRRAANAAKPPPPPPPPRDYAQERRATAERRGQTYVTADERAAKREAQEAERKAKERRLRVARLARLYRAKPWLTGRDRNERERLRRRHDPDFAIERRIKTRVSNKRRGERVAVLIRGALKRGGTTAAAMFGYSIPELRVHLERQFLPGMTWDRFCAGEIEIDHVIPLRCFDLGNPEELRAAWALPNLRPLWRADNRNKSGHRTHLV